MDTFFCPGSRRVQWTLPARRRKTADMETESARRELQPSTNCSIDSHLPTPERARRARRVLAASEKRMN